MRDTKLEVSGLISANLWKAAAVAMVLAGAFSTRAVGQQTGQKTYPTAMAAGKALYEAAKSNDETAMIAVLGPDAKQIVSSGDDVEDAQNRANFVRRYEEVHRLMKEPNGATTLYVGVHNWPLPIPLEYNGKAWFFDSTAAKMEILFRRVGRNEISTIRTSQELVMAEKEYASSHNGEYAGQLFSDPGKDNGLYWKSDNGQPQSPIGPLVASAVAEGYKAPDGGSAATATPYRGYLYRVLAAQGPNAPGGAKSYVQDGKMTGGFAFVAFPADYRSSGVKTFIICQNGVVFSKDLGPNTEKLAKAIKAFNPDATWKKDADQTPMDSSEPPTAVK
jgi:hypothetical protein